MHYQMQLKIRRNTSRSHGQLMSWLFGQNNIKTNDFCVLAMYTIIQVLNAGIFTSGAPPHRFNTNDGVKEGFHEICSSWE